MEMTMDLEAQYAREEEMALAGKARHDAAQARGEAGESPAGLILMKRALAPLAKAVEEFVENANKGRAGRRNETAVYLTGISPELAAYVTLKSALTAAARNFTLRHTAIDVAHRLELEALADRFETSHEALYRAIIRNAESRGLAPSRQAKSVQLAAKKFGITETMWTPTQRIHIGTKLIELLIESGAPITAVHERKLKSVTIKLKLTAGAEDWLREYNEAAGLARPMFLPTLVTPKPWTGVTGGAYYSPAIRERNIISRSFPGQLELLQRANMMTVFTALNGIQGTAWAINERVFRVMNHAWENGLPLPCLPSREDEPLPEKSPEVEAAEPGSEVRKEYRIAARAVHQRNNEARSRRFEFQRGLSIAADNLKHEAIYFPHRCDFRGRVYAAATTLQPQASDEMKALLHFAEGKTLGERGAFWLGVHGANLFGNDKVSLKDRYEWALHNQDNAFQCAQNPFGNRWWMDADKPWSFLAWCFEWGDLYSSDPEHFVSHLPIALDGSCNGIQHYSAMLRDPIGGAAVNLVPSEKPQDIYQRVADRVKERIEETVADPEHEHHGYAWGWRNFPIDRKITKRPVMVLPYGGMFKSCMDYTHEAVEEKVKGGAEAPFVGDEERPAVNWLAKQTWDSIGDVVVAAREAMGWLQKVARIMSKHGVPITWTTPSGFVVRQQYREKKKNRIKTRFQGSLVYFGSPEDSDVIDKNRQASSVAPNFVHSLDASALMLTIEKCLEEGITSFAMIHDSYGTHAADTDRLAELLREAFVEMYLKHDVLAEFAEECRKALPEGVELPPLPEKGSLDLEAIRESQYFFA